MLLGLPSRVYIIHGRYCYCYCFQTVCLLEKYCNFKMIRYVPLIYLAQGQLSGARQQNCWFSRYFSKDKLFIRIRISIFVAKSLLPLQIWWNLFEESTNKVRTSRNRHFDSILTIFSTAFKSWARDFATFYDLLSPSIDTVHRQFTCKLRRVWATSLHGSVLVSFFRFDAMEQITIRQAGTRWRTCFRVWFSSIDSYIA